MRVFMTGATGFVGSAVVQELLASGHQVLGLARNDNAADALRAAGAEVHPGDLEDVGSLASGAKAADAVIHAGFIHDFTRFAECCAIEGRALAAMGAALAGTDKPFVITSGAALGVNGDVALESYVPSPATLPHPRVITETTAARLVAEGGKVSVLRLAISTHGAGDHGFVPMLIAQARKTGVSAYVGDGSNVWHAVHRKDAARLYRMVLEDGPGGERYHAVGEQRVPFRAIAQAIGAGLGLPLVSVAPGEAAAQFGFLGSFAATNLPASNDWTRAATGWEPREAGLLDDIATAGYF